MTVEGYEYVQMSQGDELCGADIAQLITSLNAIAEAAGSTSGLVTCQEVDLVMTATENEAIVESPLKDPDGLITGEVDLKLIAVTYDSIIVEPVEPNDAYDWRPATNLIVSCGGEVIYQAGFGACDSRQVAIFQAYCPRDEDLTFAIETTGVTSRATVDSQVCGAVLCIGDQERNLDAFFKYTGSDPVCNDFRTALNLAAQNTRALLNEVSNSGEQTARCVNVSSENIDNLIVASNINRGATYFVLGSITISARMRWLTNNENGTIEVSPFVGCAGEQSKCGKFVGSIPYREDGEPEGPLVTFSIPVVRCGTCSSSDTLYAGMTQEVICEGVAQLGIGAVSSAEIVSVSQEYCAWVFEKVETDSLPAPFTRKLDRCLTSSFTQELANTIEGIEAFVCELEPVSLTFRAPALPTTYDLSSGYYNESFTLQEAIVPTIENPATLKKWTVNFTFLPKFEGTATPEGVSSNFIVRLLCGGNVLAERSTNWISANGEGLLNRGTTYGSCLYLSGCFECSTDEPLTLQIEATGDDQYTATPARLTIYCF